VLTSPERVGAQLVRTDRGGDVTYHGPGQLVGYPIVTLPEWRDGLRDVVGYVRRLEGVLIAALHDLGVDARRERRYPGVWVGDEKIAAVGVKVARGRTRHGFALNVDPDLAMFRHIVPCGITDRGVTSLADVLGTPPDMHRVVDLVVEHFARDFGAGAVDRQDVVWREHVDDLSAFTREAVDGGTPVRLLGRLAEAGVAPEPAAERRPRWMRVRADLGPGFRATKRLVRDLDLHTVCEEAGCPNIYECWADRTATFMILGDRCTRACGFCLVDTRKPLPLDPQEPERVACAVAQLGLEHAVITSVARDDVDDGGAHAFAATIAAIRAHTPGTTVEVLIPDCKGDPASLRSLALLARAKRSGLLTKSGIILGMGETEPEVRGAIADLRNVGVDVLTLGQYLRPSTRHLPVVRWWTPEEFAALGAYAESLGYAHVESGPLVRSSYHAKRATQPHTTGVNSPRITGSIDAGSLVRAAG